MMKIKNNMIFLFNQSLDKYSANSAKELKPQEVEILSAMVIPFLPLLVDLLGEVQLSRTAPRCPLH